MIWGEEFAFVKIFVGLKYMCFIKKKPLKGEKFFNKILYGRTKK